MRPSGESWLVGLLALYAAASFIHFAHNAEYLHDYPNLPDWITRLGVYLAWFVQAAIGVVGILLYRHRRHPAGLLLIGLYAALGFDGLLHYTRAPLGAHSGMMNFTIWFEVVAAAALLLAILLAALRHFRRRAAP